MHGSGCVAHHAAQGIGVIRMFFVQDQEILRAQKLRQKPRRAGVEVWLGPDIHRLYCGSAPIGIRS